jgi:antitoxin HicB
MAKDVTQKTPLVGAQAPEGAEVMSKRHHGSTLDSLLKEEGVFEESQALAIKEVVVWQLTEAMAKQSLSKARLAVLLKTSRSQVDRLLDPTRDVTLSTLQRAAALVGRKVQIELV